MCKLAIGVLAALIYLSAQPVQDDGSVRQFPACSTAKGYYSIEGWGASFQFPKIAGLKASVQGRDIDSGQRFYYIRTAKGRQGIQHGAGPLWSFGRPFDSDVEKSVTYEETSYNYEGKTIVDARGQFPDGKHWRSLGKFGETARYSDVDETTARIFDEILDGACIRPSTHSR